MIYNDRRRIVENMKQNGRREKIKGQRPPSKGTFICRQTRDYGWEEAQLNPAPRIVALGGGGDRRANIHFSYPDGTYLNNSTRYLFVSGIYGVSM
jgi:hypothetical protein